MSLVVSRSRRGSFLRRPYPYPLLGTVVLSWIRCTGGHSSLLPPGCTSLWGETGYGNREVNNRPLRTSSGGPVLLRRLTIKVTIYEAPPNSLTEAFLKKEDLGLEVLERIVGGEVAAVNTHTSHLHPNHPRVGLQKIFDTQIRATNKDAGPAWCIPIPGRVLGPFLVSSILPPFEV